MRDDCRCRARLPREGAARARRRRRGRGYREPRGGGGMSDATIVKPPTPEAVAAFRRHLPLSQKASLAVEIVSTYVRARRLLRREELREAVRVLRSAGSTPRTPDGDQLLAGLRLGRIVGKTL